MPSLKLEVNFDGLSLDKSDLETIGFVCDEGINRLYRLTVLFAVKSSASVDIADFLGRPLSLEARWERVSGEEDYDAAGSNAASTAKYIDASDRVFYGKVYHGSYLGESGEHNTPAGIRMTYRFFMLEAGPKARGMTASANSRVYTPAAGQDGKPGILPSHAITTLLKDHVKEVKYSFKEPGSQEALNFPLPFIVQYRENDYDFLLRWVERQGWHFLFNFVSEPEKFRSGGRLQYHDEELRISDKVVFNPIGVGKTQYTRMAKKAHSQLGLTALREKRTPPPGQIVVHDYAPLKSAEDLTGKYPAAADAKLPTLNLDDEFFAAKTEGDKLAQTRHEGLTCLANTFTGHANLPGIAPGRAFLLEPDRDWQTKSHFILSARHAAAAAEVAADLLLDAKEIWEELPEVGYSVRFESIRYERAGTYHPPRTVSWPRIAGSVTAFTVPRTSSEDYSVAVNSTGQYYLWLEGVSPMPLLAGEAGSIGPVRALARGVGVNSLESAPFNAGTEVVVSFDHGNPDRPLIIGAAKNDLSLSNHPYNALLLQRENGSSFSTALDRNIDLWKLSSPGGTPFFDAASDYSSTYLTHSSTFYNSKSRLYSSRGGGLGTNSSTFYNSMSAGRNVVASFFTLIGAGVDTYNKGLSFAKLNDKSDKLTASLATGPLQFIFTVLAMLGMSQQKERLLLTASEGSAALGTRGFFPKGGSTNKINLSLVIVSLVHDMLNEALGVIKAGLDRKKLYSIQANAHKGAGSENSVKRWRPQPIDPDLAKTIPDLAANVLTYVKLIYTICAQNNDSNGMRISTIRASDDGIKAILKNILIDMLKPVVPIVGRQDNGMTLVVESDGQTTQLSDEGIDLRVDPVATSRSIQAPSPPTKIARINLSGPNRPPPTKGTPDPSQPIKPMTSRIGMNANDIALETEANLNLTVKKNLNLAATLKDKTVRSRLALFDAGEVHVNGEGSGSLQFKGGLGVAAGETLFAHGKNVVLGADHGQGGLVLGMVDAEGLVKGAPSLKIHAMKGKGAKVHKSVKDLITARRELLEAMDACERMVKDIEHLCTVKRANPTDAIRYNKAQAELMKLVATYPTAKAKVETCRKKEENLKKAFLQETYAPNRSPGKNLELINGENESEKVTLEPKKVMVESAADVFLKAGKSSKLLLNKDKCEVKVSGNCTINGQMIKLA